MKKKMSSSSEDYLEAVYLLDRQKKAVRVSDISSRMGVTMPSVHQALSILKKRDLVKQESYGYVELTSEGEKRGKRIYESHKALFKFLHGILGLDKKVAENDACKIEHNISAESLEKLTEFIQRIENGSDS